MKRLLLLFLPLLLLACDKPEPNPEVRDPISQEFHSQLGLATAAIAAATQAVSEKKAALDKVKPQTGASKYAQKKYWAAQNALDSLLQQEKYWKIRIKERESYARTEYLKAYHAKKPWPDPKEFEEYSSEKRLREARQQWDPRQRIEENKKAAAAASLPKAPAGEGGE